MSHSPSEADDLTKPSPPNAERADDLGDRTPTFASGGNAGGTESGTDGASLPARFFPFRHHRMGGQGQVWVALDRELDREVAYKQIRSEHANRASTRRRFLFEAEVTGRLEHPGVIPVYGLGRDAKGDPYYAMRFVDGPSLRDALQAFHGQPPAGPDRAIEFRRLLGRFMAVCQTVAFAHARGVIHRDLKPANVMLGPFGETLVVDWGAAKWLRRPEPAPPGAPGHGSGGHSEQGLQIGTPAYWAPEQAAGRPDLHDERTDVYGLGAILFELLAGATPHPGGVHPPEPPSPRAVHPGVDEALDLLTRRALAREPAERFPGAAELALEVERWLAEQPVAAPRAAVAALAVLAAQHPGDAVLAEQLARQRANLGLMLGGLGRDQDAATELAASAAVFSRLARLRDEPRLSAEEANCYLALARSLRAVGRADEATAAERMAADIYKGLIVARPDEYKLAHASIMLTWAGRPPVTVGDASGSASEASVTGAREAPRPADPADRTLSPPVRVPGPDEPKTVTPTAVPTGETRGRPDDTVDGYTLVRELGRGGTSHVLLARDNVLDRPVALKVIQDHGHRDVMERALRELRVTAALDHPNIVRVYTHGRRAGTGQMFMVMEHLEGPPLTEYTRQRGPGWSAEHLNPLIQVCDALQYAHGRGVVHRDLKPSNVAVLADGRAVLFDWGLAKVLGTADLALGGSAGLNDAELTHEGAVMGTPAFMSPEQASGRNREVGPASDVFAVGVMLFEILTDQRPFQASNVMDLLHQVMAGHYPRPRDVRYEVPVELNELCARAMSPQPVDRPTAGELGRSLRAFVTGANSRRGIWGWLTGR